MASISIHKSNGEKAGDSPKLLAEMLRFLEHQGRPVYQGFKEEVNGREEWRVEVLIDTTQKRKPLIFEAYVVRSTFDAGIRDAACQAMYRLRDMYATDLSDTPYHYFPRRRKCSTDKEIHCYNKKLLHHEQDDPVLRQQIRLTQALLAVCDDGLDELRGARCKVRELEEELMKARRHKHKAIATSSPPPRRRVIVGDKKPYQSPGGHNKAVVTAPAPAPASAAHRRTSVVVGSNTNRRAWLSLERKPTTPTQSRRGVAAPVPVPAPAPCGRRVAIRSLVKEEGSGSSFEAAGGAGYRPPIATTPKGLLMQPAVPPVAVEGRPRRDDGRTPPSSSSSFEGRMHGSSNLMMAMAMEGPRRRDRDGASASSSSFDGRRHGSKLMAFILDGGVALLGKEPADASNSDDGASTSAPRVDYMEKPCRCSSARRRRLL